MSWRCRKGNCVCVSSATNPLNWLRRNPCVTPDVGLQQTPTRFWDVDATGCAILVRPVVCAAFPASSSVPLDPARSCMCVAGTRYTAEPAQQMEADCWPPRIRARPPLAWHAPPDCVLTQRWPRIPASRSWWRHLHLRFLHPLADSWHSITQQPGQLWTSTPCRVLL